MAISDELDAGDAPPAGPIGDVQVLTDEHGTLVQLFGEVDLALGPELETAGRAAVDGPRPVRIDVSELTFIDSTGLGLLARLAGAGLADGQPPELIGASPLVLETLRLAGLSPLLA